MGNGYWDRVMRRRLSRRRALAAAGGSAVAAAFLAACGGDDDEEPAPTGATGDPSPTAGATGANGTTGATGATGASTGLLTEPQDTTSNAVRGGIYLSSRSNDLDHSDPFFTTQGTPGTAEIYSRLFRRTPGYLSPQPVEYEGDLAESWEFSPDGLQLTVKLKPNAHWHDIEPVNGRALEASDIVYTWERLEADSPNRGLLSNNISSVAPITSMTEVDAHTIRLDLAYPAATVIPLLSGTISGFFWVLPRESADYDPRRVAIGSGPWVMADYQPSVRVVLKKNAGWHDGDQIYVDELHQPIVPEYSTALAQFKSGQIYGPAGVRGLEVTAADVLQTKADVPELDLYLLPPPAMSEFAFFGWNPAYGEATAFRDKRLRQALSRSINRDLWIDTFYEVEKFRAEGIPMDSRWNTVLTHVWPGYWLDPQGDELGEAAINYQYDIEEAKKLVSAAGFPDGLELKAQYPLDGYSAAYRSRTEVIISFAAEIGLTLTVTPIGFTTDWRPKVANAQGDFEGISFRPDQTGGLPHPVEFMYAGFHYQAGSGYTGFFSEDSSFQQGDPRLNDILTEARSEFDVEAQQELLHEMQRIVADEMYIVRFPGSSNAFTMSWPAVRNMAVWEGDTTLRNMWLDPTRAPLA